jgi:hypothetical protein
VLDHLTLQLRVAAWTLGAERVEVVVTPDDARREQHRPAGTITFFVDDDVEPQFAGVRRCAEAGHACAGNVQRHRTHAFSVI